MKKYLKDLEEELRKNNLSEEEIKEILADHEEMIETAKTEGLTEEELNGKFGDPKKVAEELSTFTEQKQETETSDSDNVFTFDGIKEGYNVKLSFINEDYEVKTIDSNEIKIIAEGKFDENKYNINFNDNTLNVESKSKRSGISFGKRPKIKFIIYLPKAITADSFHLGVINGDGKLHQITTKEIHFSSNNGDFNILDFKTGQFNLSTINGDGQLKSIKCKGINISTISGDLSFDDILVKEDVRINTVSGDLKFSNTEINELSLKTVSGDFYGIDFYPNELSLTSVSGDIKIVNSKKDRPIKLNRKTTVSGDIDIYIK